MRLRLLNESVRNRIEIIRDIFIFAKKTLRYNASLSTMKDKEKAQYTLLRRTHIIEKGMSLRNPRVGFGQKKVSYLIDDLAKYVNKFGKSSFLNYPISAISTYISYTKSTGVNVSYIEEKLKQLLSQLNERNIQQEFSGIKTVQKDYIIKNTKDFKDLLYNRHSIRFFSNTEIPKEIIEEALKLAQQTPSACNRQGWKTHVFMGENAIKLIKWQGGSRGFEEEIHCAILVTANLKAFLSHEIHQAYIDGGLYAMNLINALTYLGLGNIPLSCGFHESQLQNLTEFNIPQNEVPIIIIGVGGMENEFKVAISKRKNITETNTFHY